MRIIDWSSDVCSSDLGERRRFGYRRLGILLAREGLEANHKKVFRLYREEGLAVRRRRGRKRALGTRRPMLLPEAANERWSLDFVSDALADGRRRSDERRVGKEVVSTCRSRWSPCH